MGINYGFNKVRYPSPVLVGGRIRMSAVLTDVREGDGFFETVVTSTIETVVTSTIEIDGLDKPACVVESVGRLYR